MNKMLEAEIWTIAQMDDGTAVLLRPLGSDIAVPIFIGESEAQSILLGLEAVSRPQTHDLLLELIKKGGLALYRAEVHDLRDNIFYARLLLTGREFSEKAPLILDSRPSDVLALAVRCKCPVFIAPKVADQAGLPVEFFLDAVGNSTEISADTSIGKLNARRETLQLELDRAVAAEEYEKAAELRDVLALMDKERRDE
ncbi:bifunctional nuclease family protein [Treponema primitia]|uniref:bifunctional nuclease family protein n=1 Tax=Treponema primitia TaxID=88058 RepID=UPI00398112D0